MLEEQLTRCSAELLRLDPENAAQRKAAQQARDAERKRRQQIQAQADKDRLQQEASAKKAIPLETKRDEILSKHAADMQALEQKLEVQQVVRQNPM